MPTDPLAISTGIGQGEAQVFNIPKSTFYRDKLNEAKKADADVASDVSTTLSKAPWSNDLPEFREMQGNIRNYVKNNRAALVKGDFDAKIELERMKQEYLNRYEESKSAEKFYDKMSNFYLSHPDSYYQGDYERMQELALKGSKYFSPSTVRLRKNFLAKKFNDDLTAKVKSIPETFQGAYLKDIKDDETGKSYTYLVTKDGSTKTKLRDVAGAVYDAWAKDYTEEQMIAKDVTREAAEDYAENYLKSKFKYSQPYDAEERKSKSGLGAFDPNSVTVPEQVDYNINLPQAVFSNGKATGEVKYEGTTTIKPLGSIGLGSAGENITLSGSTGLVLTYPGEDGIVLTKEGKEKKTITRSDVLDAKELDGYKGSLTGKRFKADNIILSPVSIKSSSGSNFTAGLPVSEEYAKKNPDNVKYQFTATLEDTDGNKFVKPLDKEIVASMRGQANSKGTLEEFHKYMYQLYALAKKYNKEDLIDSLGLTKEELAAFSGGSYKIKKNNVSSRGNAPSLETKAPSLYTPVVDSAKVETKN